MSAINMDRPPRKYLDAERTVVNPSWLEWRQEQYAAALEDGPRQIAAIGDDPARYFPEAYDKLIDPDGAWILVLEEPHTELQSRFRVPLLSLWRARPYALNSSAIQVGRGRFGIRVAPHQAVISTPGGDLHLWPHEYHVVTDPYVLMSCDGALIHSLGGQAVLDDEVMFYLQSRGISHQDAVLLLIEQVKQQDFVYVTFPAEVTALLDGVGQPLWRHVQRHPRRQVSA